MDEEWVGGSPSDGCLAIERYLERRLVAIAGLARDAPWIGSGNRQDRPRNATSASGVRCARQGWLPKRVCNQNFETAFVIELAAARKRLCSQRLERPTGPRTIEMLDRAEAFQDLPDRGLVNNRAELARMHGISRGA